MTESEASTAAPLACRSAHTHCHFERSREIQAIIFVRFHYLNHPKGVNNSAFRIPHSELALPPFQVYADYYQISLAVIKVRGDRLAHLPRGA